MTTLEQKIWPNLNVRLNECWEWQKCTNKNGYGVLRYNGKNFLVHRLMWELFNGPIEDDKCICHKCDNPKCCNPEHLYSGTQKDNMIDRDNRNKYLRIIPNTIGENNGYSKLTEGQILEIRERYSKRNIIKITQQQLADEYNISQTHISEIINDKSWKHI